MSVTVSLFLFAKPEWVFADPKDHSDGWPITAAQVAEVAKNMGAHLRDAAVVTKKLEDDGWACDLAGYELQFSHDKVNSRRAALKRLKALGIDPKGLEIQEWDDEEAEEMEAVENEV